MCIQALKSHQIGKKYVLVVSNVYCFFKSSAKDPPVSVEESTSKVNNSSSSKLETLELNVLSSEKISAGIMRALHRFLNGISKNSNQDTSDLFQTMFPDSKITKSFQMRPNQIGYSITHGVGPYFKGFLVVSFDESLNKKTQTCQMDLLIRYWNEEKIHVSRLNFTEMFNCELELLKLIDIGSCSLHIIHSVFKKRVESTDWEIKKTLKAASPYFSCKEK